MNKPTKSEVEITIIDKAAALFARHGFEHASLQQIASALGYSKAGLLHHFPSKRALYDAAISTLRDHVRAQVMSVHHMPVGRERDLAVVRSSLQFSFDRPGISALGNRIAISPDPEDQPMNEIGLLLYEALGVDIQQPDTERLVRIGQTFSGLGIMAAIASTPELQSLFRAHMIATAMDALGHR